jgi:hypothetical protein
MGEDRRIGMAEGGEDPLRHLLSREMKIRVYRAMIKSNCAKTSSS